MPTITRLANRPLRTFLCTLVQKNGLIVRVTAYAWNKDEAKRTIARTRQFAKVLRVEELVCLN